jgi:single-strand selective monofunctional uracil DNA glycosylase
MAGNAALVRPARELSRLVNKLSFAAPVAYVYNPLTYAWQPHERYLRSYGDATKRVLFLGMNPGPFGMVQTGIPFGQVAAVREWLKISGRIDKPLREHPRRRVTGFDCQRSEISGERLWGLFRRRFATAEAFFQEHFVANYCPLAFLEESGRNRTPDKLWPAERSQLFDICDAHLRAVVRALKPEWVIAVGDFAAKRAAIALADADLCLGRILHPSPACPASNNDWAGTVTSQLRKLGVWP